MTKTQLIAAVAEKTGMTKKDSDKAVHAILDVISEALADDEKVSIVGFGTFEVRDRKPRMGHNPRTKEPMEIAASRLPVFRAGKGLKESVQK